MFPLGQLALLLFLMAGASLSCEPSTTNSTGIMCRFTKDAALVFNQETSDVIQATFRHASFPDIKGEKSILFLGSVSYVLKNLQINNMSVESSDVDLSKEKGILISIQNVAATFKGTMNYAYTNWLLKINNSLDFKIEVQTDVDLGLTLAYDNGRIALTVSDCVLNFHKLTLQLQKQSQVNWIRQLLTDFVSFTLRQILKGQICAEIHKMSNLLSDFTLQQAGAFLSDGEISTSIELTGDPMITSEYVESWHKGSVFYKNFSVFQKPNAIPFERVETRMFNLWVSEPVINSLLYAAYLDDRLSLKLVDDDLLKVFEAGEFKHELNVLQQVFPAVPINDLMVKLTALRPPSILFKRVGTILEGSVAIEVDVVPESKDSYTALYMEMDIETTVQSSYTNRKIHLQPSSNHWSIKTLKNNPAITLDKTIAKRYLEKFFSAGGLQKIISYVEFYITALLDKKGLQYFNISNTVLEPNKGYVTVATDFQFPRQLLENFLRNFTSTISSYFQKENGEDSWGL
ncbi:cholesteryl ester transfer protein [Leucoraja erinacea]|uniref:cholesteryl ester transfer protein n=1 Tax=Leucoraja erinaceus TaxID=7782 RepID=UPI002456B034|nr:cholesteryl ester transfer protein [Leucoraja erinacea]